jgi:hypothetical protein
VVVTQKTTVLHAHNKHTCKRHGPSRHGHSLGCGGDRCRCAGTLRRWRRAITSAKRPASAPSITPVSPTSSPGLESESANLVDGGHQGPTSSETKPHQRNRGITGGQEGRLGSHSY